MILLRGVQEGARFALKRERQPSRSTAARSLASQATPQVAESVAGATNVVRAAVEGEAEFTLELIQFKPHGPAGDAPGSATYTAACQVEALQLLHRERAWRVGSGGTL